MIHAESIYPPALAKLNGKLFIVPGYIEVPNDTTLDNIQWIRPKVAKTNIVTKHVGKYVLNIHSNGKITCDCPGYTFRRKCKHAEAEKNSP